jgi:hypothetical protein
MPSTYQVTVLRRNIGRLFLPRGEGYNWMSGVRREMFNAAVAAAPSRTGDLKRGHRSTQRGRNQYRCDFEIYNVAPHSEIVHGGRPAIEGPTMRVPRRKGPLRGAVLPKSAIFYVPNPRKGGVAAQAPQPWLATACGAVAARHGAF